MYNGTVIYFAKKLLSRVPSVSSIDFEKIFKHVGSAKKKEPFSFDLIIPSQTFPFVNLSAPQKFQLASSFPKCDNYDLPIDNDVNM